MARRISTAKTVSAEAGVLSTHLIAPLPGPTAADGAAIEARITAAAPKASPLTASRMKGWTGKNFAR